MANEKQLLGIFILFLALFTISNVSQMGMIASLPQDFKLTWGVMTLLYIVGGMAILSKGMEEEGKILR